MTKQEKIIEVYGEHWAAVEPFHFYNGWIRSFELSTAAIEAAFHFAKTGVEYLSDGPDPGAWWRPLALKGIGLNNGWHAINGPEDLPKVSGWYKFLDNPNSIFDKIYFHTETSNREHLTWTYTHYRPIKEDKPPIY